MHKTGKMLSGITDFPYPYVRKLAELSIDTAEEFVAVTGTRDGRMRVSAFLDIDEVCLDRVIALAKETLPGDIRKEMETPVDTGRFGLGALEPDRENGGGKKDT